jgi:hypothetical protein
LTQTSTKRRNIFIAAIVIIVLVISSIFALIENNPLTTTRISLSLSTNQTDILQGNSTKIPIKISLTGNPEKNTLTSIVNASKINCDFDPANSSSSFNTTLTINVDDSAQGGNYSVTVKATSPVATANASCIITVLTRNVTVSGKINIASSNWSVWLDSLTFKDVRTGENIKTKLNGSFYSPDNSSQITFRYTDTFAITLRNKDFYYVEANYEFGVLDFFPFSNSELIGNLTVSTPAGNNMMPYQDFTLTPDKTTP